MNTFVPQNISEAILKKSNLSPLKDANIVTGYNFNNGINFEHLFGAFRTTGFQATNFALAVEQINQMIELKCKPLISPSEINLDPCDREETNCKIFLGFTSNIISSGVRECIAYIAEHNMIDCIVTTAGGVEEDLIKCLSDTYIGDFYSYRGAELRDQGINRIGNLLVPNDNYCKFEDWIIPIFDEMLREQKELNIVWTPSKMIKRLGKEINNPKSYCYWCYKNNIPVYSPALTDGSLGDMLYLHSYKNPGLILDIIQDLRQINNQAVYAKETGMIILGGGLIKHHICNANLMRNGAEYSVFINTACDYDGSDSGARPDEAISWGKIKKEAHPVKVHGEASLIFPLIVAETFAKFQNQFDSKMFIANEFTNKNEIDLKKESFAFSRC